MLTIRVLGRPTAAISGATVSLPSPTYLLLTALAALPHHSMTRVYARRLLWASTDSARRAGNLRQLLLRVQRAAPSHPVLLASSEGDIRLNLDHCELDLLRLQDQRPLAVEEWPLLQGELLEEAEVPTLEAEELLREINRQVVDWRIRHIERLLLSPALAHDAVALLGSRLLELDPCNELAWQSLLKAAVSRGDLSGARQLYLKCQAEFKSSLNSRPSAETERLALELGVIRSVTPAVAQMKQAAAPSSREIPRVILLPPDAIVADPLLGRLGRALLEDITVSLSNQKLFKIIANHTSFELLREAATSTELIDSVKALDIDYAVYITLQGGNDDYFATCRLTKVATGEVLWAVELPLRMETMTASFHKLGRRISTSLTSVIEQHELGVPVGDVNASAYRLYLEGKRHLGGTDLRLLRQARKWLRSSIQTSADYSPAHTAMARTFSLEYLVRLRSDQDLLDQAETAASFALQRDPTSGQALRELGYIALYRRRHAQSLGFYEEARNASPHDADLLADYADALCHDGDFDNALAVMQQAFELNPLPSEHYHWYLGGIQFMRDDYDSALDALRAVKTKPAVARLLTAIHAARGDLHSARASAETVLETHPDFRTDQLWHFMPDRRREDTQKLVSSLNMAGLA